MTIVERFVSDLSVTMTEDGEIWVDAGSQPSMRIDVESVSGLEAFEILKVLIEDHYLLNWADAHWRDGVQVPKCDTAREAIRKAMSEEAIK